MCLKEHNGQIYLSDYVTELDDLVSEVRSLARWSSLAGIHLELEDLYGTRSSMNLDSNFQVD